VLGREFARFGRAASRPAARVVMCVRRIAAVVEITIAIANDESDLCVCTKPTMVGSRINED
jgi:hypothetical protein